MLLTPAFGQSDGEVISQWSAGFLDIHHINTGKGECAFLIFPDGTTLLIDAGATKRPKPRVTDTRPNDSRLPGEWIARYIKRILAFKPEPIIDYVVLSHFHGDHMGEISETSPVSKSGKYRLAGITRVAEEIPIRRVLDRGWPDYDFPAPVQSETMENYRTFLRHRQKEDGLQFCRFVPGRNDQITLVNDPDRYQDFEVRNIAANGEIWTGVGTNTRSHFPSLETIPEGDWPSENMCSIALRVSYGRFDYFTGADIPGIPDEGAPLWHDLETPVAKAVGPVEVNVLNHHGYLDSENDYFLSVLRPRVHIIQVWAPSHPSPRTLRRLLSTRLYPGPRDIFATNMMEANRVVIGNDLDRLKSQQGHILVRVEPGGGSYHVAILDDSAETFRVRAVHGPYQAE
jgi:beta-lactamase superfamily II metal-dependent hydrolase